MLEVFLVITQLAVEAPTNSGGNVLSDIPPTVYGLLGAALMAVVTGRFLVPRYMLDRENLFHANQIDEERKQSIDILTRERKRADDAEAEVRRLNNAMYETMLPAVLTGQNVVSEATVLFIEIRRERDLEKALREQRQALQDEQRKNHGG